MAELKRVLGLPMLTFYGTGMILGAGIYTVIGKAAGIAGETVWLSMILSICITTLIYVLVAFAAISLLPIDQLAQSKAPLADAVYPISSKLAGALGGIALFATANTVLIALATTSRVLYGMAKNNAVPQVFAKVHKTKQTPWFSDIVICFFAILLLPLGRVEILASISSFAIMLAFLAVHVTLIVLRIQRPEQKRPFSVPLSFKKIPILPILGGVITVLLTLQFETTVYVFGAAFLIIITISQLMRRRLSSYPGR